jgi:hypothetical protein
VKDVASLRRNHLGDLSETREVSGIKKTIAVQSVGCPRIGGPRRL